ncbi:MAG: hypothetical protein FJ096_16105 [Deltaproteobacteria bacterium]|nr:hypothetical protein [Deltaproteobacteria bacterium]
MMPPPCAAAASASMGLGAGGKIRQQIHADHRPLTDYELDDAETCHLHILAAATWRAWTGEDPPERPPSAELYARHGLPWFDHYADGPVLGAGSLLRSIKSIFRVAEEQGETLPGDEEVSTAPLPPLPVVYLGPLERPDVVRGSRGEA